MSTARPVSALRGHNRVVGLYKKFIKSCTQVYTISQYFYMYKYLMTATLRPIHVVWWPLNNNVESWLAVCFPLSIGAKQNTTKHITKASASQICTLYMHECLSTTPSSVSTLNYKNLVFLFPAPKIRLSQLNLQDSASCVDKSENRIQSF
jgi:hypothetical protein